MRAGDREPAPKGDWWNDLDDAVLRCLAANGTMSPAEIGRALGVAEPTAISLICLLAMEDRVRIGTVELRARTETTRAA